MDVKVSPAFFNSQQNFLDHLWRNANIYLHLTNNSYMTSNKINKLQPINTMFKSWSPITTQQNWPIKNHNQRHKYHHLTKALHLTLKMTTAQVFKMKSSTTVSLKTTRTWIITLVIVSGKLRRSRAKYLKQYSTLWLLLVLLKKECCTFVCLFR